MLFFKPIIVAIAVFALGAISAPVDTSPVRFLENSATPKIGAGYTGQQTVQILDGIHDAFLLASHAISKSGQLFGPISSKCFDVADRSAVMGVFKQVLQNPLLRTIAIIPDHEINGTIGCERGVMASLLGGRYGSPSMVICPLSFTFGGINKRYGGVVWRRRPALL